MARTPPGELASAPLFDHLEELRRRIIYAVLFWAVGVGVAWNYHNQLLALLKAPLKHAGVTVQLVATQLTDQFMLLLNISMWAGLVLALPFIAYQVWAFIAPGLYPSERRWAVPFILGAALAFSGGVLFCYKVLLPNMIGFLLGLLGTQVDNLLRASDYIGTVITFMVTAGLIFELPILSVILTRIGIVNWRLLSRVRKFAFIVILILAAVITPTPDPYNMMLVAVPIYALYELGVLLSRLFERKPQGVPSLQG